MSEIEKLMQNAGLLYCKKCRHDSEIDCIYMCESKYSPFTAEKQLELIKWLAKRLDFGLEYYQDKTWAVQTQLSWEGYEVIYEHKNFEEALAGLINTLWQDLTESEKAEIKEILK